MTIVADASSLILLSKIRLLEKLVERTKIIVPKKVYGEVVRGKEKGREDAFLVERLVKEKRIKMRQANEKLKKEIERTFNLHEGENEALATALENKHTILTDDKKCFTAARTLKLNFITSLDVVVAMYKKGRIDKRKAMQSLDELLEYGWYKRSLIEKYRREIV